MPEKYLITLRIWLISLFVPVTLENMFIFDKFILKIKLILD